MCVRHHGAYRYVSVRGVLLPWSFLDARGLVGDQVFYWLYTQVFCNFKAELELQELGDGDLVMGRHLRVRGRRIFFDTGIGFFQT